MARIINLRRSNRAHDRLCKKYDKIRLSSKGRDRDVAFVKMNYHSRVAYTQSKIGRVLTKEERKKAYNTVISEFF